MGVGKEATLGIGVRHAQIGVEAVTRIAHHHAAVALQPGSVAQPPVLQLDIIRVILYAVRRHFVIGIVYQRHVRTVEPFAQPSANLGREPQLLVVRATEQLHRALQPLRGDVVREQVQHAADGIRAVEQSRRTFDNLGAVHRKLVYLQPVVVAPLLALVLYAILGHRHAVEPQTANRRLRLPRADGHSLHARHALQRLHKAA